MKILICRNSGSMTVEAAIIVPLIILSIMALIFMGLVLYQRAQVRSAADMAAEAGAAVWGGVRADTGTGRRDGAGAESRSLYWRLADADRDEKLDRLLRYAEKALEKGRLLKPESSRVTVDIKDYLIYKKLEVTVDNAYELPLGGLLRIFGASGRFNIKVTSESIIDDPVEFRRNLDFAVDLERELEGRFPGLKNLREKARDALSGVKGKIDEFFE